MPDRNSRIGERVIFRGHVQGVGFRYTAREVASAYEVGGWVRNLPDQTVEMVVAGPGTSVDRFVKDLCARMDRFIREVQRQPAEVDTIPGVFEIRR